MLAILWLFWRTCLFHPAPTCALSGTDVKCDAFLLPCVAFAFVPWYRGEVRPNVWCEVAIESYVRICLIVMAAIFMCVWKPSQRLVEGNEESRSIICQPALVHVGIPILSGHYWRNWSSSLNKACAQSYGSAVMWERINRSDNEFFVSSWTDIACSTQQYWTRVVLDFLFASLYLIEHLYACVFSCAQCHCMLNA